MALNRPPQFDTREQMLRRRLNYYLEHPTSSQVGGLAQALYQEKREAYREAVAHEASKWGVRGHGELDPFVEAQIWHDSQNMATKITSTYMKFRQRAIDRGDHMGQWQDRYTRFKAPQVLQYEYAKSWSNGQADFYNRNLGLFPTRSDGLPALVARVEPREARVPDVCQDWIDLGDIPYEQASGLYLPAHPHCPHHWSVERGDNAPVVTPVTVPPSPVTDPYEHLFSTETPQFPGVHKLFSGFSAPMEAPPVQDLYSGLADWFKQPPPPDQATDFDHQNFRQNVWMAGLAPHPNQQQEDPWTSANESAS